MQIVGFLMKRLIFRCFFLPEMQIIPSLVPHPFGPGEIDGLLVPLGKPYKLLTDYLTTGKNQKVCAFPRKVVEVKPSIHISPFGLLGSTSKHILGIRTS